MESEGKLKSLTLQEKLKLIELVERGMTIKDVSEEHSINRNTLHFILKNREKIRDSLTANPGISGFKRIRQTKSSELEHQILEYMHDSRNNDQKLSGSIIKTVALELAAKLGVKKFAASNGWLFSFLRRNKISMKDFNKGDLLKIAEVAYEKEFDTFEIQENQASESIQQFILTEHSGGAQNCEPSIDYEVSYEEEYDNNLKTSDKENLEDEYEEHQAGLWRNWCRMCGNCNSLPESEHLHEEITKLFQISDIENVKVCEHCYYFLEEIKNMLTKCELVQQMFASLQERESTEVLTSDDLNKARVEFGFDEYLEHAQEIYLDEVDDDETTMDEANYEEQRSVEVEEVDFKNFEEVVYDELDSPSTFNELELGNEEHVGLEISDENTNKIQMTAEPKPHEQSENDSFIFQCHVCHQVFEKMYSLSNHTRELHQTLPKVACSCGRFLSTWDSLMAHKRKHSPGVNPFRCDLCNLSFRTKTGLSIHIKFKHEKPSKPNICELCKKVFKDSSTLKNHMRTHLSAEEKFAFECPICGRKVVNKYSLKYHIQTIHEGRKQHFCHLCGRGFGNKSNLRSHLISHTTENVSCTICGGKFKNRISLQSHKKLHKDEARVFPCSNCDKTFYNRTHLARHMTAHSEEKAFKCSYPDCNSEYKWEKDLRNHIAGVHSALRPYKCMFCNRGFVDASNLRKHKLKEHKKLLAEYEQQYGKTRKSKSEDLSESIEICYETVDNVE